MWMCERRGRVGLRARVVEIRGEAHLWHLCLAPAESRKKREKLYSLCAQGRHARHSAIRPQRFTDQRSLFSVAVPLLGKAVADLDRAGAQRLFKLR